MQIYVFFQYTLHVTSSYLYRQLHWTHLHVCIVSGTTGVFNKRIITIATMQIHLVCDIRHNICIQNSAQCLLTKWNFIICNNNNKTHTQSYHRNHNTYHLHVNWHGDWHAQHFMYSNDLTWQTSNNIYALCTVHIPRSAIA